VSPLDVTTPLGVSQALLPEILLAVWTLIVLLVVAWRHTTAEDSRLAGWLSLAGIITSGAALAWLWTSGARATGLGGMVALDEYRFAAAGIILLAAAGTVLVSLRYMEREGLIAPEYYPLILLGTAGMLFMAGAEDMMVLFLGLEVMSVAVYVLAGYDRRDIFSSEAALKYFLIGAFASGFLLYGIALVYGATGQTGFTLIGAQLGGGGQVPMIAALGLGLLLIGFGFKVAAVPFHMWAPDVYDGSPTPVTGYMATGVKVAAFAALSRLLVEAFPHAVQLWQPVVGVLAVATMLVGNLVALAQRTITRMLAYSSVAHAGYLLVAIWPGTQLGASAVMLYLFAYSLSTLAAFALLASLGRDGERTVRFDDLAGLASRRPWTAFGLAICMLSLLGFPGTFGFIGKWYILQAVIAESHYILPVVLVITSVVSAGYYLPVIMSMYMRPAPEHPADAGLELPRAAAAVVIVSLAAVVLFGILPGSMVDAALRGAGTLAQQVITTAGAR
jgi:NADH-quinone oxidoreductase subunit N